MEGVFGPGSLSPEDERAGYGFVWANGHRVPKMDNPESVPAYVIQSTPKPARKALRLKTLDQDIKTQFSEEDFTAILVARQIDDPQSNKEANIVILDEHGKPLLPSHVLRNLGRLGTNILIIYLCLGSFSWGDDHLRESSANLDDIFCIFYRFQQQES